MLWDAQGKSFDQRVITQLPLTQRPDMIRIELGMMRVAELRSWAFLSIVVSSLWLTGCASSEGGAGLVQMQAPNGASYYRVKCNGTEQDCLAQAHEACGGSYQVITSESHAGGAFADVLPGPVTWYSMHFVCGPSDGTIPTFPHGGPTFADAWSAYQANLAEMNRINQQNQPTKTTCTQTGVFVNCTTQ